MDPPTYPYPSYVPAYNIYWFLKVELHITVWLTLTVIKLHVYTKAVLRNESQQVIKKRKHTRF